MDEETIMDEETTTNVKGEDFLVPDLGSTYTPSGEGKSGGIQKEENNERKTNLNLDTRSKE